MKQSQVLFAILIVSTIAVRAIADVPEADGLAIYLRESGLTDLYLAELRNLCLDAHDVAACRAYSAWLVDRGQPDRAIALAESVTQKDRSADLTSHLLKAETLLKVSRHSDATGALDDIIASLPPKGTLIEAVFLRARCRLHLGQVDDALIDLHSIEPYFKEAHPADFALVLGECEEAVGNLSKAKALYEEALEQGSREAALGLLRCTLKEGDIEASLKLRKHLERSGIVLPPRGASRLAIAVGEIFPEMWHALVRPIAAVRSARLEAGTDIVTTIVNLAEHGEDVGQYCDSLLGDDLPVKLKQRLRYARALSAAKSAAASDSLASLARRGADPDFKLRSAASALSLASEKARQGLAVDLVPSVSAYTERMSPDERLETAKILISCGMPEDAIGIASSLRDGLEPGFDDAAMISIAALLEQGGSTDMALHVYSEVANSLIPTEQSLEAGQREYLLRKAISTSAAREGIAAEVERIARGGASDLELGDLFMDLGDFEKASQYYRKALGSPPEGTHADAVKLKLSRSLSRQSYETGDDRPRREALGLAGEIASSKAVDAGMAAEALELSTNWFRLDHDRAFDAVKKLGQREHVSSEDLYHCARSLYCLFLKRDGNVYTECVLTLKRLIDKFPKSREAPLASLLLARAKFIAGDYVGALEAYERCVKRRDNPKVESLSEMGIGECYLYSGGFAEAISHFRRVGERPVAAYHIARCYDLSGQPDSAALYYKKTLLRLSGPRIADAVRFRLSLLTLESQGLDRSLEMLDSPLEQVRERLSGLRRTVRAYALGREGYVGLARPVLRDLASRKGGFGCEALLLAASLGKDDDKVSSISVLEPGGDLCDDIFGTFALLHSRALYACSAGAPSECSQEAQRFKQRFPLARSSHVGIAVKSLLLLFRQGEADSADVMLDGLLRAGASHNLLPEAIYRQGVERLVAGDYAGGVKSFQTILEAYPGSDLYHDTCFKLGTAYFMTEAYDSSAMYFEIAAQSEKATLVENALFNLGIAHEKKGDLEGAAEAFWSLAVRFPLSERFDRALMRSAYALEQAGKPEAAIPIYKSLLQYAGDRQTAAEATYWIGESLSEMEEHVSAAVEFLRVGHSFPDEAAWAGTACYRAGIECEAAGLLEHAEAIYEQNARRFGEESDWGRASVERLTQVRQYLKGAGEGAAGERGGR